VKRSAVAAAEPRLKSLMLSAREGDAAAYHKLLTGLSELLRPYFARRLAARSEEIEDLVQATLIALHRKRATYLPDRPLTPWVFGIARYQLLRWARRLGRIPVASLDEADDIADPRNHEEAAIRHDLRRLLELLPDRQGRLVAGIKLLGLSISEAARLEGMSDGAAKVSVHRGLKALAARVRDAD
jgi:RNA polymerase sigma-70 factor (ECF subfamily)